MVAKLVLTAGPIFNRSSFFSRLFTLSIVPATFRKIGAYAGGELGGNFIVKRLTQRIAREFAEDRPASAGVHRFVI